MAGLKKKLAQVGQEALERLELPVNIAAGVARIELLGNRELYMDRHRGVLPTPPRRWTSTGAAWWSASGARACSCW